MSINESTQISTKKFYRAKEVSEYFGIGISTVWSYNKKGKIKAYKLSGGITVFNIEELEKDLLQEVCYE